jgi:serine/threonine protein phosphatase PrpC
MNISSDLDFAFLGCDGIFDVLSNEEINEVIWETVEEFKSDQDLKKTDVKSNYTDLSNCLKIAVNNVLKKSLIEGTEDNITAIIVVFRNLLHGSVGGSRERSFRSNDKSINFTNKEGSLFSSMSNVKSSTLGVAK